MDGWRWNAPRRRLRSIKAATQPGAFAATAPHKTPWILSKRPDLMDIPTFISEER
jgi:hypothetical protein